MAPQSASVVDLKGEQMKLEREMEEHRRAMNNVAPLVTVNLQEIWSETLKPMQAHSTIIVNLHSQLLLTTERLDNLLSMFSEHEKATSNKFRQTDTRMDAMDARVTRAAAKVEEMGDWKTEVLAHIRREQQEREEYQRMQHTRMEDLEERLEFKTKEILQNVENLQFAVNKESQKREEFEKTFHELKLGWDDKLVEAGQRHDKVVERLDELKTQQAAINTTVDGFQKVINRHALQIVELENRDIPDNIKKLPTEVDAINDLLPMIQAKITYLNDMKDVAAAEAEMTKSKMGEGFQKIEGNLAQAVEDARQGAEEIGRQVRNELAMRMDQFNTTMRENARELAEGRQREMDEFQASMKYFVSPKDVVDMIQKYDPLANQDPLPEPPVSVADVRAMFDTQRVQKSAMMRGVGTTNVQELVENFNALQKTLLETTQEAQAVETKVFNMEKNFKRETLDAAEEMMEEKLRTTPGGAPGAPARELSQEDLEKAKARDREVELIKKKVKKLEESLTKALDTEQSIEYLNKKLLETREELASTTAKANKTSDNGSAVEKAKVDIEKLFVQVYKKFDKDSIPGLKKEVLEGCMEQIKLNQVRLKLSKEDMSAIGPIKTMLEDVLERQTINNETVALVKAAVCDKADLKLVQNVSNELTNIRHIFDVREESLRTDLHTSVVSINADMGLKLDEPRVRETVEQMLQMFQGQFIPKGAATAPSNAPPAADGAGTAAGLSDADRSALEELRAQVGSLQGQIVAVDTAVERQSMAQTEVVNMQLKKVVQELDELRAVIQEHRKHLNDKASLKRVQELDALLREIVGLLLQGDTSTAQVLLTSKLGEAWRCLSCNQKPSAQVGTTGPPVYPAGFSPPRSRAQTPADFAQAGGLFGGGSGPDAWRSDSAMDNYGRPYSPSAHPAYQGDGKGHSRPLRPSSTDMGSTGGADVGARYGPTGYENSMAFRPSSPMPPTNFLPKGRDILAEVKGEHRRSARSSAPTTLPAVRPPSSSDNRRSYQE